MLEASDWGKWLSHKGKVLVRLMGRGCCGPQAATTPRGVTHQRKMVSEKSDSAQGWILVPVPSALLPETQAPDFSCNSNVLHSSFAGAQAEWL